MPKKKASKKNDTKDDVIHVPRATVLQHATLLQLRRIAGGTEAMPMRVCRYATKPELITAILKREEELGKETREKLRKDFGDKEKESD